MLINDIHHHVVCERTTSFSHYTFDTFLKSHSLIKGKTTLFLHPQYKRLYSCQEGHRCRVIDVDDGVRFVCESCGKIFYQGSDPYREGNEKLIEMCKGYDNLYPFLYLTLSDSTMQQEMDYFEKNYMSSFYGIKVHPNLCSRKMSEIGFTSNYPMIIHCGMTEYDNAKDIITYAQRYPGKVILAHLARCEESVLKLVAKSNNIYIDTSPTYLPFQVAEKLTNRYFSSVLTDTNNITQLFRNLIDVVGKEKIIFGTDIPWGNIEEARTLYEELALPENQKKSIFQDNFDAMFDNIKQN